MIAHGQAYITNRTAGKRKGATRFASKLTPLPVLESIAKNQTGEYTPTPHLTPFPKGETS
jgi:hypothetical protein